MDIAFTNTFSSAHQSFSSSRNNATSRPLSHDFPEVDLERSDVLTEKQQASSDIGEMIAYHKANSLAYQLMQAIARENYHYGSGTDNNNFVMDADGIKSNVTARSTSELSLSLDVFQSETFEFSVSESSDNITGSFSISRQDELSFSATLQRESTEKADPLILNLDNTDFSFSVESSVLFDLNADGQKDIISNLNTGNAFLAFDKNRNGVIDDGRELFGDASGAEDGFSDLASYDLNDDGLINAQDQLFDQLLLLSFSADGEQSLNTLSSERIESLSLYEEKEDVIYNGDNQLTSQAIFIRGDNTVGRIGDFLLSIS